MLKSPVIFLQCGRQIINSLLNPLTDVQQLFENNKLNKDELIDIGLKLRKQENLFILMKSALDATQACHINIKPSSYHQLIS